MYRDTANWGIGASYVYIPGAIERENRETILQARTRAKNIHYGDKDHPFRYVLNGQFAGVESRSYNYEADRYRYSTAQNIVVGTTGQGGKGVFSLNGGGWLARTSFKEPAAPTTASAYGTVTNMFSLDRENTKKRLINWDSAYNPHTSAPMVGLEKIGYTIGQPILAQMSMLRSSTGLPEVEREVRIIAFVANGYNGTEDKPSLYVIDAAGADFGTGYSLPISTGELGKVLKKIEMPVPEDNSASNALNGAAIVDLDFNGVADVGYIGDFNGNLYRLDFRETTVDNWKATLIYKGDPTQPITTTPSILRESDHSVTVIFGTGSQIYKENSMDRSVQSIYGIKDDLNIAKPDMIDFQSRRSVLVEQTLAESKLATGQTARLASSRPVNFPNKGWYIDLLSMNSKALGERVISNMEVMDNTLFVTSYYIKPDYIDSNASQGPVCAVPMGYAGTWQMQLNAKTGGNITDENANTGKHQLVSGKLSFIAGLQYQDRIPPVSFSTTKNFPYNSQGQLLPGGKLYTPGKVFKPRECDGSDVVVSMQAVDGRHTVSGMELACGKAAYKVKMLSWRIMY